MQSHNSYERLYLVSLPATLDVLRQAFANRHRRSTIAGQEVNTHSLRLQTFVYKGVVCAHCGIVATHFALERGIAEGPGARYHLNLWGVNAEGEEVLFTHDHIVPRMRGGANTLDNTQTMCGPCNWKKSSQLESELASAAARFLSCDGPLQPAECGYYEVSSTTCRPALPQFLEFDGSNWVGLVEFKEENGGGDVRWLEGSAPRKAPPDRTNPFAPRSNKN